MAEAPQRASSPPAASAPVETSAAPFSCVWRARQTQFRFPRPALLMGIVTVTPDSFSDGGRYFDAAAATDRALELIAAGAEIIDVGGESTRPGATPVSEAEELRRVLPVIERVAAQTPAPVSIDTRKPEVAKAALEAGATIVNDVGAGRADARMRGIVAEFGAGYVCMHMQGAPGNMQRNPRYDDVVREVGEFFRDRLERLARDGVELEQVALDPGIGFGKTLEHNLDLLANLSSYRTFQRPLLLGASRKSFIGKLLGAELDARMPASLACAVWAANAGVGIIRTHDVAATWQAVRMAEALRARERAVQ